MDKMSIARPTTEQLDVARQLAKNNWTANPNAWISIMDCAYIIAERDALEADRARAITWLRRAQVMLGHPMDYYGAIRIGVNKYLEKIKKEGR